jgi:hypothetical protein
MISKETLRDVMSTIMSWCSHNEIAQEQVIDLFGRLTDVKGNESFKQSIAAMYHAACNMQDLYYDEDKS